MYCKRCGARLQQGMLICPECGARQRRPTRTIRCARCHDRAAIEMTVCPHCGRDLRPAGPRWGLWLGGLVIVVLAGLWGLGRLPVAKMWQTVTDTRTQLASLVQIPDLNITVTPATAYQPDTLVGLTPFPTATPTSPPSFLPSATRPAPTSEGEGTRSGDTATPEPTPTPLPPTETPAATATPAPTPTIVVPAATKPPVTPTTPAAANTPATGPTTYRVQAGDTLEKIGARFGVVWQAIAAANNITAATILRVGQELAIPPPGAPIPPTATPRPRPTATPVPPTATPVPSLAAPVLVNPGDQTPFSGEKAFIELVWQTVANMPADAQYQVTVRWTEKGVSQEYPLDPTPLTSTRAPLWLWQKADQPARRYTWFVTVVLLTTDGQGGQRVIPLSPPSEPRTFTWD
ncbi:MAG: hypothetical protein CVU38_19670 [Chloroflexi bacterium HGW-Chloroflexi-1]|nr:MAG: hypothetical protein CVU38_19670 [Chloroflexi bacterium HGW-Chloroflexi-1]